MEKLWGIDLGGTKIEGVIIQIIDQFPEVITRLRVPTEAHKGYQHILEQIQILIMLMEKDSGMRMRKMGIGTPGIIDIATGKMKNCNTVCLNGKALWKDLTARLNVPIKIANDANCFALAEANIGVVKEKMPEAKVVFGSIMGTGVGGGIIINSQLLEGRHGIGGEWGHNFLDSSGGNCYCGKMGCVERVISGKALEGYYERVSGQKKKLEEIVRRARNSADVHAANTLQRLLEMFGKAISVIINVLDPEVIVLGGGVGNIEELYTFGVKEVEKHVFNDKLETKFLRPKLGDSAGVFGAALLNA